MKAIMMSIRPKWVAKILNGEKTIEIRKKFPSDYVGWVYIYCTKDKNNLLHKNCAGIWWVEDKDFQKKNKCLGIEQQPIYNGKVVARFWCDKVEEHRPFFHWCIEKETCLTRDDVLDYLDSKDKFVGNPKRQGKVYAIHITKVDPFDEPKEIKEFEHLVRYRSCKKCPYYGNLRACEKLPYCCEYEKIYKAPQSWCYIEV